MEHPSLYEKLYSYGEGDYYPYHMPGHKRKQLGELPEDLLKLDVTEIEGFDNLHHAEGILKELQEQASVLYGADETFLLVNGSTCGVLSAVSAALPRGGRILMSRDCHLSAYHAAYLRGLEISYLYPKQVEGFGFQEAVTVGQVEEALEEEPDIGAVLIVSPTYEGRIADIKAIAEAVHERGIPLIVDEAHGAHLGFAEGFAAGSCTQGADLVIHSVHKTLPAMTQTALLHVNGELADRDMLRRFLRIYQSSSPSYVLMASIEDAINIVAGQGQEKFRQFRERYRKLTGQLRDCRHLKLVPWDDVEQGRQDIGKLVISAAEGKVSGQWIYERLLEKYHLQCEMAAENHCLAMFTIADEQEAYQRMLDALTDLDREIAEKNSSETDFLHMPEADAGQMKCRVLLQRENAVIPLWRAWDMPHKMTSLSESMGCTAGDFIGLYPPGSPILVPGEIITEELYSRIKKYLESGLHVTGIN